MIITTTHSIERRKIIEYKGIVFGEVIYGVKGRGQGQGDGSTASLKKYQQNRPLV